MLGHPPLPLRHVYPRVSLQQNDGGPGKPQELLQSGKTLTQRFGLKPLGSDMEGTDPLTHPRENILGEKEPDVVGLSDLQEQRI